MFSCITLLLLTSFITEYQKRVLYTVKACEIKAAWATCSVFKCCSMRNTQVFIYILLFFCHFKFPYNRERPFGRKEENFIPKMYFLGVTWEDHQWAESQMKAGDSGKRWWSRWLMEIKSEMQWVRWRREGGGLIGEQRLMSEVNLTAWETEATRKIEQQELQRRV